MELSIDKDLQADFEDVLRHCALPNAIRVNYTLKTDDEGAKASLKYYDTADIPIGDDRDYDILKSCFTRLSGMADTLVKRLIEQETKNPDMSLNQQAFELKIDLDLISGQMSFWGQ